MGEPRPTTQLLLRWSAGDASASKDLLRQIEGELRRLARAHMAGQDPGHTLQPTALVNEAYLRLVQGDELTWRSREHFFSTASRVMRSILVDHARRKKAEKRGGDRLRVSVGPQEDERAAVSQMDVLDLHLALEQLAKVDGERVRIVELRFFAGLKVTEISSALDLPVRTVERRLHSATAWLRDAMRKG